MEELVLYLSLKYAGDFEKIYNTLLKKEIVDQELKKELFNKINCSYTTIFSDDYPEQLNLINCPPFVLYYYGDLSLVKEKNIAVIGTVEPDLEGISMTTQITEELIENGYVTISHFKKGISQRVHATSITNNASTIAVLDSGIDNPRFEKPEAKRIYDELKKHHLIMSEYPFDTKISPRLLPASSRILAGLANDILVTQLNEKDFEMMTIQYALEQGKDIYSVPDAFNNKLKGTNKIIEHGAYIYNGIESLESDYNDFTL